MSLYIPPAKSLDAAWLATLRIVNESGGGTAVNCITTIAAPQLSDSQVRVKLDEHLQDVGGWSTSTVAGTIFPLEFYPDPKMRWSRHSTAEQVMVLDDAAAYLYQTYEEMLPTLVTFRANRRGTYFSRMISWPGKASGGLNQLEMRIMQLRAAHRRGMSKTNAADIAVEGAAELHVAGVQLYRSEDRRQRSFPCLVHIDLTVHNGQLHLLAVYRHWHVVTKGYGNLLGLAGLMHFLTQQTGYELGELVVQAGMADAELDSYGGKSGISRLIENIGTAVREDQ